MNLVPGLTEWRLYASSYGLIGPVGENNSASSFIETQCGITAKIGQRHVSMIATMKGSRPLLGLITLNLKQGYWNPSAGTLATL